MGGFDDRLKYDLWDKASDHFGNKQYLSIAQWPQAFGGK